MSTSATQLPSEKYCERITLAGHVQGVGFRPFVYRLALTHGLSGHVRNCLGEVEILACGTADAIDAFRRDLVERAPPLARPHIVGSVPAETAVPGSFEIADSASDDHASIYIPADSFMCEDCRRELHDPADRRYRYPFINCTQCGPRYTLIEALPYDRPNTSMASFPLCSACEAEYTDPFNRRFHAEPVACPDCGPSIRFVGGNVTSRGERALDAALASLEAGDIVAVKGIGGYHLMCDARSERAVARLRARKPRPDKPLAVMFPLAGDDGLERLREAVDLEPDQAARLASPERPIVLASKTRDCPVSANVAPGLAELGVFLPYSPLHELLLATFDAPLVATSGNISGEPVLTDETEAARRLAKIADAFVHHDRPIVRPADDSVYRRIAGETRPIRIGRGAAPLEMELPCRIATPTLAVGGHMKGTVALAWDNRVVVSPHIGEMDSPRSLAVFEQVAAALQSLYRVEAERIVCDAHGGYTTHSWAQRQHLPVETVWHHRAHASALAAELDRPGKWLVFAWDGVGLGEDGTLWGGEALYGRAGDWRRVASLRPFRLPGGERVGREPWRSAAAVCWESGRRYRATAERQSLARAAWERRLNCPETSAAGRIFDAAAALVLGLERTSFEAQGPMMLESLCRGPRTGPALPLYRDDAGLWRSDWAPLLDTLRDTSLGATTRAAMLHSSMADAIVRQVATILADRPFRQVGLTGGVFQNRVLSELVVSRLRSSGVDVFMSSVLPANDAGLSFGQAAELAAREQHDG